MRLDLSVIVMKKELIEVTAESLRHLRPDEKQRVLDERKAWLKKERENDRKESLRTRAGINNMKIRKRILSRRDIYIDTETRISHYVLLDKQSNLCEPF